MKLRRDKILRKESSRRRIYFAKNKFAGGVLEDIDHYKFLN
jgi:hypothetical protein